MKQIKKKLIRKKFMSRKQITKKNQFSEEKKHYLQL